MITKIYSAVDALEVFEYLAHWHKNLAHELSQARGVDAEKTLLISSQMLTLRDIGRFILGTGPEHHDGNPFDETDLDF